MSYNQGARAIAAPKKEFAARDLDVIDHTHQLSLNLRLVADTEKARDTLKQFAETAEIPTEMSMECALGAIK